MTDLGKFTTPIRRNVEPYLVPAPVEEYFEHWGHAWAITHIDQTDDGDYVRFSDKLTVTHVTTGLKVPFISAESASDAKEQFHSQFKDKTEDWMERNLKEHDPIEMPIQCPHCNGTGTITEPITDSDPSS